MNFDGEAKRIILGVSDGSSISATTIYDAWRAWANLSGNDAFDTAFVRTGGVSVGGALTTPVFYVLNTAAGWRIRPREANHALSVTGNLLPSQPGQAVFAPTVGSYNVSTLLALAGVNATPPSAAQIAQEVWTGDYGLEMVQAIRLIRRISDNRLDVDVERQLMVLYADDGTTELRTWELETTGGEDVTTADGVQTRRLAPTRIDVTFNFSGDQEGFYLELSGDQAGNFFALSGDVVGT